MNRSMQTAIGNQPFRPLAPPVNPGKDRARVSAPLAKAVSLHLNGKPEEALAELKRALDSGPQASELDSAAGHIQFELNQFADAAKTYGRLLELDPRHKSADYNLAVCLGQLDRWDEAAASFKKALDKDSSRDEAQVGLGICFLH